MYCLSNISNSQFEFLVRVILLSQQKPIFILNELINFPAIFTKLEFSRHRQNYLPKNLSIEFVYCDLKLHSEEKTDDISTTNHGMSFKKDWCSQLVASKRCSCQALSVCLNKGIVPLPSSPNIIQPTTYHRQRYVNITVSHLFLSSLPAMT